MKLDLEGRWALITGASKGIGAACAQTLASEGCNLIISARDGAALAQLKGQIETDFGVTVSIFPADLSKPDVMHQLSARSGECDVVINNAGDVPSGSLEKVSDEALREGFALKVFGYIALSKEFYLQRKGKGGVILNIIGNSGENWDADYFAGSTANAALMSFTKAIGGRSLDDGIRVVGVNPGPVATDRMVKIMRTKAASMLGDAERWQELFEKYPSKRPATSEEVADLVAFLVSPRCGYISGTIVTIDGGIAARGSVI